VAARSLAALIALGACAATPKVDGRAIQRDNQPAGAADHDLAVAEAKQHWEKRLDENEARAAVDAWKKAVKLKDDDPQAYLDLAHAEYFVADAFASKDARMGLFEAGASDADRGLRALSQDYEKRRSAGA
jgi:hypothetical protein